MSQARFSGSIDPPHPRMLCVPRLVSAGTVLQSCFSSDGKQHRLVECGSASAELAVG